MARCLKLAALAAKSDVPVLILGETGTGKTLLAHAIHNSSARAQRPFISFNACAMSDTLLESQLFGHERGAFTGAQRTVKGKFELADTGTLFFDEIADMSALAQGKILRAVEYGQFERLGAERMLHADVRIISATNQSLRDNVTRGKFREDLYHRLKGVVLIIPPLRERREELPGLIAVELKAAARAAGKKINAIHPAAMDKLLLHDWRGNLRELNHLIRTVMLFCDGATILPEHVIFESEPQEISEHHIPVQDQEPAGQATDDVPALVRPKTDGETSLAATIDARIRTVYEQAGRNQRRTARLLGISRTKLRRHLQRIGLK
jgi:transcriptional regulator with PAS, ATPase and Fis domain